MKKISFCTTCKGRLWQLIQTLPENILKTKENEIDILILDYHSDDGLENYITKNYKKYLEDKRLKYFKLITEVKGFDMAFSKHIIHLLAEGDVLFNLDADNTIGPYSINSLSNLPKDKILIPKMIKDTDTSRCGRIGIHKENYLLIGGYDKTIRGMAGDDGDLIRRCYLKGIRGLQNPDKEIPIQQSREEKNKYVFQNPEQLPDSVEVKDFFNTVYVVDLKASKVYIKP